MTHHQATDATLSNQNEFQKSHWHAGRLAPTTLIRVCPECAGPVVRNSGCMHCAQCGWGKCG